MMSLSVKLSLSLHVIFTRKKFGAHIAGWVLVRFLIGYENFQFVIKFLLYILCMRICIHFKYFIFRFLNFLEIFYYCCIIQYRITIKKMGILWEVFATFSVMLIFMKFSLMYNNVNFYFSLFLLCIFLEWNYNVWIGYIIISENMYLIF